MNNKLFLSTFIFFALLTLFSLNVPFFWDSTFFSALSVHFYDNGFRGFIAPLANDTGGFPLYSIYLTLCWKLFGKSLLVSHITLFPFLMGITYEYFRLAKRFLQDRIVIYALLLLAIQPVFFTQAVLMGYDIIIAYFFLLALNAMYSGRRMLYGIALVLLCTISVRGIMLAAALFLIDVLLNKKWKSIITYLPAVLVLFTWTMYHHAQTGWHLFSPLREHNAEEFSGAGMMLRQSEYVLWKVLDLGNVTLWLILAAGAYFMKRNNVFSQLKELFLMIVIPLIVLSAFMILVKNPVGHKYFLVIFLLLGIGACCVIQQLNDRKKRRIVFCAACISLLAGNFILYPQRLGNAWDSSVKIMPYFSMKEEMDAYIKQKGIDPKKIASQFPLTLDDRFTKLSDRSYSYTDIDTTSFYSFGYFLYSNMINTNRMKEIDNIREAWTEEKKMEKGMITLILYRNPRPLIFY